MSIKFKFPNFKRKAFTVSYDDGTIHDRRMLEIMTKHGIKGTLNVNSSLIVDRKPTKFVHLTAEELLELVEKSGFEVAVHGHRHLSLADVEPGIATYDVMKDREVFEALFGRVIKGMAYANGSCSDEVVDLLKKCGIEYARTTVSTGKFDLPTNWLLLPATCHHKSAKLMDFAREFVGKEDDPNFMRNNPMLFYVWGHSYEFDRDNNWEVLEELCEYVGGREDVWYATNGEIYEYHKAYKSLRFSCDESLVHNPSALDVYFQANGENVVVHAGETVRL
ncbi:MAG: polysaccharide deacetylase family protein [Clostridia bacterium]|nr:polysaccharide deacetylase family protein [Clostridia bacterium]